MSGWVLVLMVFSAYGGGPAMERFQTKAACEKALAAAQTLSPRRDVLGVCIEDKPTEKKETTR